MVNTTWLVKNSQLVRRIFSRHIRVDKCKASITNLISVHLVCAELSVEMRRYAVGGSSVNAVAKSVESVGR